MLASDRCLAFPAIVPASLTRVICRGSTVADLTHVDPLTAGCPYLTCVICKSLSIVTLIHHLDRCAILLSRRICFVAGETFQVDLPWRSLIVWRLVARIVEPPGTFCRSGSRV